MLVVCEGVVLDTLLVFLLPGTPWAWAALGVHLYALVWLAGFVASMVTRPHRLSTDALVARDGIFTELVIPYTAIEGVRIARHPHFGRSGSKVDPHTGDALLAIGDANVVLDLDPTRPVRSTQTGHLLALRTLRITADEPAAFVAGLRAHTCFSPASGEVPECHGARSTSLPPGLAKPSSIFRAGRHELRRSASEGRDIIASYNARGRAKQ